MGLGGHTFLPEYGGLARAHSSELRAIVSTALAAGVNYFDVTYDEERVQLGEIVRELGVRDAITVSAWMSREKTQTAEALANEAQRALDLLQMDHVDVLYLDWTCTAEQVEAMVKLRQRGLTRFVGLLGQGTAEASDLSEIDVLLVNHNYFWRDREPGLRKLTADHPDTGLICLEPLGRGRFAADEAPGMPVVSACLKYAFAFEPADAVLVAVRNLGQLEMDLAVWQGELDLTPQERAALEAGAGYDTA
jgi:aryl-alcohol dehydrogenase-like predicted oxidoreductase